MLNINNFTRIDGFFHYISENEYIICPDARYKHFDVIVTALDEDGEPRDAGTYAAPTLSTAIAIIERLEAGKPI